MSSNRKPYVKPQVASFAMEERFTALQHLVADLGADVRRVELELRRNKLERAGERLLTAVHAEIARLEREKGTFGELASLNQDIALYLQELR